MGERWRLDTGTAFGQRVERRLWEEAIIWLVTVGLDGTPQPSPVWFLWDGDGFLIYSRPDTPKLRNIERNPRVSLHLDGDGRGGNIVVITGDARIVPDHPPATEVAEYMRKYDSGGFIARIGRDAAGFARAYSVSIRIRPTGLRGH